MPTWSIAQARMSGLMGIFTATISVVYYRSLR